MKKQTLLFVISGLFLTVKSQELKFQVGLELGKYFRNYTYVQQVPAELVAMVRHDKKLRIYPTLSIGTGAFKNSGSNYSNTVAGQYLKAGADWYLGKPKSEVNGVLACHFIAGNYSHSWTTESYNPVWGNFVTSNQTTGQVTGLEMGFGFATKLSGDFEFKSYFGGRGFFYNENEFVKELRGIIPGFGRNFYQYTGSAYCSIIISYLIQ